MRVHPYQATATYPSGCIHTPAETRGAPLEAQIHELMQHFYDLIVFVPLEGWKGKAFGRYELFFESPDHPEIKLNIHSQTPRVRTL